MMVSFRTRLFVVSGLIVVAVITMVMLVGWSRVLAFEAQRLEQRLCIEAKRVATQPARDQDAARLGLDIMLKLQLTKPEQVMLHFESTTGGLNFQSGHWKTEFALYSTLWLPVKADDQLNVKEASLNQAPPNSRPVQQDNPPLRKGDRALLQTERPAPTNGPGDVRGTCETTMLSAQGGQWRAARFITANSRGVVAVDLAATEVYIQSALRQALQMVVPLALLLTALGAWLLSAMTMRPVNRLTRAMKSVTPKALDQRLPSDGEDREFKVLINAYNKMLSRLEISFQQASRFSADAAHELKTPLTILQGRMERALNKAIQPTVQAELTELLEEVARLSAITRKLLLLSQADAGHLALQNKSIDLSDMLDNMAADAQMLLVNQTFNCTIARDLTVQGDAVLLQQLFNNLINNALRYCPAGGWIKLRARALPMGVEITLANSTKMISLEQRAKLFDRFYRGDAAHNRRVDGNGLGLSLAREITKAHGGDLVLLKTELNNVGLRLTLPY